MSKPLENISWDEVHEIIKKDLPENCSYPHGIDDVIREIKQWDLEQVLDACIYWHQITTNHI